MARVAFTDLGHIFGWTFGDDATTSCAAFGAEVDDPVGGLDDIEVMLDDHHRVSRIDQPVENFEELANVVEVEAGGGLVEQIEGAAGLDTRKFGGQLHALGFAAGKRGGRLAE